MTLIPASKYQAVYAPRMVAAIAMTAFTCWASVSDQRTAAVVISTIFTMLVLPTGMPKGAVNISTWLIGLLSLVSVGLFMLLVDDVPGKEGWFYLDKPWAWIMFNVFTLMPSFTEDEKTEKV